MGSPTVIGAEDNEGILTELELVQECECLTDLSICEAAEGRIDLLVGRPWFVFVCEPSGVGIGDLVPRVGDVHGDIAEEGLILVVPDERVHLFHDPVGREGVVRLSLGRFGIDRA